MSEFKYSGLKEASLDKNELHLLTLSTHVQSTWFVSVSVCLSVTTFSATTCKNLPKSDCNGFSATLV